MPKKLLALFGLGMIVLAILSFVHNPQEGNFKLTSPLTGDKVFALNQWLPQEVLGAQSQTREISAKSALFIDTKSGQVLFAKDSHQRLPIASLVKVMTVLIALEHKGLEDTFTVSGQAASMEPDHMELIAGERHSLRNLLYGIFLVSANDGAETIAEGTTGNREGFIKLMNEKARLLGMKDTYYANPTGLDEDKNNSYSSAYDLAVLTRYLIRTYPGVVEFSSTYHIQIPKTEDHQDYDMYSGINLLTTYPGVIGFKTGFTPEAGLTLITLARENNHEVIGVLLGSQDRRDEARELLDYSFKKLGDQ